MRRRYGRPATLAQVLLATVVVNTVGGVLVVGATRLDPPQPEPVADTVTADELVDIIAAAIESAPDTPEGRDMVRTMSEIATGERVVTVDDWPPEEDTPTHDRQPDAPSPTGTVPAPPTTVRTVTADDWRPEAQD